MEPKRQTARHAVTLVELMLALVLLSVVIMTGLSMELGLRRIFSSADLQVQMHNDISSILTLVTKDINRGIGYPGVSPLSVVTAGNRRTYSIVFDSNQDGARTSSDQAVSYEHNLITYELSRRPNSSASYVLLSNKVVLFSIGPVSGDGTSAISIQLRNNPSTAASYFNPSLTVASRAQYRGNPMN